MGWFLGKGNVGFFPLFRLSGGFLLFIPPFIVALHNVLSQISCPKIHPHVLPKENKTGGRLTGSMAQQDFGETFRES
jgi:hypothetical protein